MSDPVRLATELGLAASEDPAGLVRLDFSASAGLDLPGIKASIEGIGIGLIVGVHVDGQGVFRLTPRPVFLPPTGMSAELTLPIVSGGGYLGKTDDEFRGAFVANIGIVQATAFGILGTQQFSFLVLMAAEFTPPLQLSFGFTLIGVGGLVGIHRRADVEALRDAAMSGRLSQLLFPRDPVAEAPRLLGTLSACFPYQDGSIIVGPMIKVGWGTPTLISATLATLAEPMDARIIILGRVAVTLPAEDVALVRIEAVIFGTLDDRGVSLDGTLVDSHIIGMPIRGDIAIRLLAGPSGLFVFSAGGFHPDFQPPPGLEGMHRLSMDMSPSPILRLGLQAYFAVTSTAVMFGAAIDLMAGFDGFGVRGHAGFDALLSIDPFYFTAALEASVSVVCADFDVASVSLRGELSGPTPWSISGHASISILFFDVDVDLPEITWGPARRGDEPAADPLERLREQVGKRENWLRGSVDVPGLVRLRPTTDEGAAAVHPLGQVEFVQSAIPLDVEIRRVDGHALAAPATLTVRTGEVPSVPVTGSFAPVRFFDVDPAAATGGAGFVELVAGRRMTSDLPSTGEPRNQPLEYEQKVLMAEDPWLISLFVPVAQILGSTDRLVAIPAPRPPLVTVESPHVVVAGLGVLGDAMGDWSVKAAAVAGADPAASVQRETFIAAAAAGTASFVQGQSVMRGLGTLDGFQLVDAWEVAG